MIYTFPLQKILDLKTNQTSQAKWLLQSANQHLKIEEQHLNGMIEVRRDVEHQIEQLYSNGSQVSQFVVLNDYLNHVDSTIHHQNQQVKQAETKVNSCREDLTQLQQQEKMWNKLKEKRVRQHLVELRREEQKNLDEISSHRHFLQAEQAE
jgi:flagellar FliJ protein